MPSAAICGRGSAVASRSSARIKGAPPPTWSVIGETDAPIVSFGLVDTIFFWTFDEGVSNHYSRDTELMIRTISGELARAGHLSHAS